MAEVREVVEGIHAIDLRFQGMPGVIAAYLIQDGGERALVETGPSSTLPALLDGLHEVGVDPATITKVLVTHIHLDHAGAAGTLLRRLPDANLYVHDVCAPHAIDPSKLLVSAGRIYGKDMERLWGEVLPVPEDRVIVLQDGDRIAVGAIDLEVLYTPGHASHHVVYHDAAHRLAFTGDVAAVRMQGVDFVRPPTPPPDIDLELWSRSLQRIRDLRPRILALTHFGPFTDVESHLRQTEEILYDWADVVRRAAETGQDRTAIVDTLRRHGDAQLLDRTRDAAVVEQYELATPYGMTVDGYLRYFLKRDRMASGALHPSLGRR